MSAKIPTIVTKRPIPTDQPTFKLSMHPDTKILDIEAYGSSYSFLTQEPVGGTPVDFTFMLVGHDVQFDRPQDWSYFGTVLVVVDPDADRPWGEPRHIFGGI